MSNEDEIGKVFHALGDPTRRRLVERLSQGPASVSALAALAGVTLTAVGQHLEVLEAAGLARTQKLGRVRSCRLDGAGFNTLESWSRAHRPEWEQKLDRLEVLLRAPDAEWLG
ncbi:MAG: metalloregulator ArsR/SmtB family transcription factor [Terracidiphilus sp.]